VFGNVTKNWGFRRRWSLVSPSKSLHGMGIERSGFRRDPSSRSLQELCDLDSARVCHGVRVTSMRLPRSKKLAIGEITLDRDVASATATCFHRRQAPRFRFSASPTCKPPSSSMDTINQVPRYLCILPGASHREQKGKATEGSRGQLDCSRLSHTSTKI
jgi:hypothetical protein